MPDDSQIECHRQRGQVPQARIPRSCNAATASIFLFASGAEVEEMALKIVGKRESGDRLTKVRVEWQRRKGELDLTDAVGR